VTIAGQSAGASSIYHLVNSPLTKGMIRGAIAESGIRYFGTWLHWCSDEHCHVL
jgi:carboxylesterase type B